MKDTGQKIGELGPIQFIVDPSIRAEQITGKFKFSPDVDFKIQPNGNFIEIRPITFFQPDSRYWISLSLDDIVDKGVNARKEFSWTFETQPECIIYIGSAVNAPEIWKYCLGDKTRVQLSQTNGHVADFDPASNGKSIVYSVYNQKGGSDIWLMDRDGKNARIIHQCDTDQCSKVKFLGEDRKITFVTLINEEKDVKSAFRINLLDISDMTVLPVTFEGSINPSMLEPGSLGKKITFFEAISSTIWIYDLEQNSFVKLPAGEGLGGSWNRNDDSFTFSRMISWGGIPYGEVVRFDPSNNKEEILFGGRNEPNEYFNPQWRPQHDFIAVSYRPIEGSASKQIILISKDGNKKVNVTHDQLNSYGAFTWSIDGQMIAFQRIQMGASKAIPEVGIWSFDNQAISIIERNATSPQWLP